MNGPSYAILRNARDKSSLKDKDLGIQLTSIKRAVNGSLIIEIPGEDMTDKADVLMEKLRQNFNDNDVRVLRPTRTGDILVAGFDDLVIQYKIGMAVSARGGCPYSDVRVGLIRPMRSSLYSVWTRCPLAAAGGVAEVGKLSLGWSVTGVSLLERRPFQCYRCMALEHTKERCPSAVDRTSNCSNCGSDTEESRYCRNKASCTVCEERGLTYGHTPGSKDVCKPVPPPKSIFGKSPERRTPPAFRPRAQKVKSGGLIEREGTMNTME